jgi:hypothetical protein
MAWVNGAGEEGACSAPVVLELTGQTFAAVPPDAPDGVTGWNVYVGDGPETMTRQNGSPLARGAAWVAESISAGGARPGNGQAAGFSHALPRILQRG